MGNAMTIFNNIVNREFRDYAANARYPFTEGSTLKASDGRMIPDSMFIDAVIYPDDGVNGRMWIYGMRTTPTGDLDIGIMRDELVFGRCIISKDDTVGFITSAAGLVCGTLVTKEEGLKYVSGMASYATLFFNPDGMAFRPERVLPILRNKIQVTVNDTELTNQGSTVTVSFSSDRFSETSGDVSFDSSVRSPLTRQDVRIRRILGDLPSTTGTPSTDGEPVVPHSITISAPRWSNLQVLTENNKIVIHKRGD